MVNLNKEYYFNDNIHIQKIKTKKKQIILLNTTTTINDFFASITFRYNKKFTKIPTFTINKTGFIFEHFNPSHISKLFESNEFNKQSISIAIENVGWLDYSDKLNCYLDWRNIVYNEGVFSKNWRGKKYWAEYTNEQFSSLVLLIDYLCNEYSIEKEFVGNNVFLNKSNNFKGILSRSNFSKNHYDLTPAFDFDKLMNKLR